MVGLELFDILCPWKWPAIYREGLQGYAQISFDGEYLGTYKGPAVTRAFRLLMGEEMRRVRMEKRNHESRLEQECGIQD